MSNSYVDGKIREALVASKGSRARAQQLLMAWAAEDPQLMLGIAQPFLKAISAAAVERGIRQATGRGGRSAAPASRASSAGPALSKEALANVLDRLGRDPDEDGLPGVAAPAAPGPMRSATMVVNSGNVGAASGVTHEKAMMAIAKAFVAKKIR